jgi:hypothetical protein
MSCLLDFLLLLVLLFPTHLDNDQCRGRRVQRREEPPVKMFRKAVAVLNPIWLAQFANIRMVHRHLPTYSNYGMGRTIKHRTPEERLTARREQRSKRRSEPGCVLLLLS